MVLLLSLVLVLVLSSMERHLAVMNSLYDDGHCHSNDGVSNSPRSGGSREDS